MEQFLCGALAFTPTYVSEKAKARGFFCDSNKGKPNKGQSLVIQTQDYKPRTVLDSNWFEVYDESACVVVLTSNEAEEKEIFHRQDFF